MKSLKYSSRIVILLFLLISILPACSSGNPKEIKIGAVLPLSGSYASDGDQMLKALQMAVDEQNAQGGLLGRQLKLLVGDVGELEVEKIQAEGKRLLNEKIDVVLTGYADYSQDVRFFGEYEIPFLHADCTSVATDLVIQDPQKYSNVFQYCPSEISYGIDAAANLFQMGENMGWQEPNKKIAIIKLNIPYNLLPSDKFAELVQAMGYKIAIDELIEFGEVNWESILEKIEREQPAYITFWDFEPEHAAKFMVQFSQRFAEKGLNALLFMQYTPSFPSFLQSAASFADGLLWTSSLNAIGAGVEDYKLRWLARYHEEPKSIYGYVTRDGFDIWARAVEKAGCVDCYAKVIENIRNTNYPGLAGVHVFATDQQSKYGADFIPTIWYQIWNGEHFVVGPTRYQKTQPQLPPWIKE